PPSMGVRPLSTTNGDGNATLIYPEPADGVGDHDGDSAVGSAKQYLRPTGPARRRGSRDATNCARGGRLGRAQDRGPEIGGSLWNCGDFIQRSDQRALVREELSPRAFVHGNRHRLDGGWNRRVADGRRSFDCLRFHGLEHWPHRIRSLEAANRVSWTFEGDMVVQS